MTPGAVAASVARAEVRKHQPAVLHPEQVVGFEVAMNDARGVQGGQARDHRPRVGHFLLERPLQRPPALQLVTERATPRNLHRQKAVTIGLADVEDPADVRVLDRPPQPQLARKSLLPLGVAREFGLEDLQRHDILGRPIEHPQDDSAPPLPDDVLDLISARQHRPPLDVRRPLSDEGLLLRHLGDAVLRSRP